MKQHCYGDAFGDAFGGRCGFDAPPGAAGVPATPSRSGPFVTYTSIGGGSSC